MKFSGSDGDVSVYRIGRGADRWRRRWQAELVDASMNAERGWTRSGAWRRMDRAWRSAHRERARAVANVSRAGEWRARAGWWLDGR